MSKEEINIKSSFELAASKLGFEGNIKGLLYITPEEEQEALLKIFYYAGYLDPNKLWQDLNNIGGLENSRAAFGQIYQALVQSKALQDDPKKFDAALLRKNLFGSRLDEQDAMDFLLYLGQHAFRRKSGQERDSLESQIAMKIYMNEYREAARALGLIDRIKPSRENYDAAWIAGTSHPKLLARMVDFFYIISKYNICIKGETSVLTGEQELYAEIQVIEQSVIDKLLDASKKGMDIDLLDITLTTALCDKTMRQGKKYIASLAEKNGIKLNPNMPFITYKSSEECPLGRKPNKHYPNYEQTGSRIITESLMAQGLLEELNQEKNVDIISTALQTDGARPTTATTVYNATQKFIQKIKDGILGDKKCFHILLQSNQPYTQRQTITVQQEVNKVLCEHGLDKEGYEITIDGIGSGCKEEISTIHSTFEALMAEKWSAAIASGTPSKRDIKDLLFQTRKSKEAAAPHP